MDNGLAYTVAGTLSINDRNSYTNSITVLTPSPSPYIPVIIACVKVWVGSAGKSKLTTSHIRVHRSPAIFARTHPFSTKVDLQLSRSGERSFGN